MGPMEVASIGGHCYTFVLICNYSSHAWVVLLKNKSKTLERFKVFVLMVERLTGLKIKFFCSGHGGEFMSHKFTKFLEEQGITCEMSVLRMPQQNGVVEHMNQTLVDGAWSLLHHSGMSKGFWAEAINIATHILNCVPHKGLDWRMPYKLLFGKVPEVSYLHVFGCCAWALNNQGKKWDAKALPIVLIGYKGSKAYQLWNPASRSVVVSANIRFDEGVFPSRPTPTPSQPVQPTTSSKPPDTLSSQAYTNVP